MTTINFGVQWHITDICNLRCKHCYREEQQKDLSLAENIKIFENFSRLPKKLWKKIDISLTGGEALLYPYIKELAEYLRSNEVVDELHLMTNGTIYSPEIVAFLHKYNIPAIQISIDGNQESHDFIRGKGNFAKSIENIKRFIENGITIQVHLVLNKNNIKDVFSLIKLLDSIGVSTFLATHLVPIGEGANISNILISKDEWKCFQTGVFAYEKESKPKIKILKGRATWNNFGEAYGSSCPVGINSLNILSNGDVVLCRRLPIVIGNLLNDSIFSIWYDNDVLWKMRDRDNLSGKCASCEDKLKCGGCRALAYAFGNGIMGEDPYCWR